MFQTAFSGHAELATADDDIWRVKVSQNGSSWTDALVANEPSGLVTLPASVFGARYSDSGGQMLPRSTFGLIDGWTLKERRLVDVAYLADHLTISCGAEGVYAVATTVVVNLVSASFAVRLRKHGAITVGYSQASCGASERLFLGISLTSVVGLG